MKDCNHNRLLHKLAFSGFNQTKTLWCSQNGGHMVEVTPEMVRAYEKRLQDERKFKPSEGTTWR